MNGEVSSFIWTAFVNDAHDRIVTVEERTSRHTLRKLLRYINQRPPIFDGERTYLPVPNIEPVAWGEARISYCGKLISDVNNSCRTPKLKIVGGRNRVLEKREITICVTLEHRRIKRVGAFARMVDVDFFHAVDAMGRSD